MGLCFSCQTTQQIYHPRNVPAGFVIDNEGVLIHSHSGAVFPMYLEKFQRGDIQNFDDECYDISVGYYLDRPGPVEATFYLYPAKNADGSEIALEEELYNVNSAIRTIHPDAIFFEEKMDASEFMYSYLAGIEGIYSSCGFVSKFHTKQRELISQTYLFKKNEWFIKIRFTSPWKKRAFLQSINMVNAIDLSKIS